MNPIVFVSGLTIGCAKPTTPAAPESIVQVTTQNVPDPSPPKVVLTTNPPPPPRPSIPANLIEIPTPTDIPDFSEVLAPAELAQGTFTEGLALSADLTHCYKEFWQKRSLHPHVRKFGGRLLEEGEKAMGPEVQCASTQKDQLILHLRAQGYLPAK